jgi:hypothetical protein
MLAVVRLLNEAMRKLREKAEPALLETFRRRIETLRPGSFTQSQYGGQP